MSHANEEYIKQSELEQLQGAITALPSPISQAQYYYIIELIDSSILADIQKKELSRLLEDGNLTSDQANKIIVALLDQQINPLDRAKNGETLRQHEIKKAVRKACEDPNT
jgi:transcriptional regulator CtsR